MAFHGIMFTRKYQASGLWFPLNNLVENIWIKSGKPKRVLGSDALFGLMLDLGLLKISLWDIFPISSHCGEL